jgi:uncharacterized protein YbaA (DUF1428 family)
MTDPARRGLAGIAAAMLLGAGALAVVSATATQQPSADLSHHPYSAEHTAMMQRMRVDASPAMVERMRTDPMWQMMRDPRSIQLMEQEQAAIDRMLGRSPAAPGR